MLRNERRKPTELIRSKNQAGTIQKKKNQEAAEENKQHEGEQQVNYDTNESGEKNNGGK